MKHVATVLLLALAGCVHAETSVDAPMVWGCKDLVVEGSLVTTGYIDMSAEDDVIGHGQHSGTLTTSRVLRGKAPGRRLKVFYFGHANIVSTPLRFVLIPVAEGYTIRDLARPRSAEARLAKQCDPALDKPAPPAHPAV